VANLESSQGRDVWVGFTSSLHGYQRPRVRCLDPVLALVVATVNSGICRPFINDGDHITFPSGSSLPAHFTYWRYPNPDSFHISPPGHPNTLELKPSHLNLTALNGNYAGPTGQTFISRRQQDTLFTYSVNLEYSPSTIGEEAGVTVFLIQNHHLDVGIVLLPASARTASFPGTNASTVDNSSVPKLHVRFRGMSYIPVPADVVMPLPEAWQGKKLTMQIKASNMTHYTFSVGPAEAISLMQTVIEVSNAPVSWGFTGKLLQTASLPHPPPVFLRSH